MAVSRTLAKMGDRFGFNASVAAHPRSQWVAWQQPSGAPSGAATASGTTDASSGDLAFTGLAENTDYVAYKSGKPLVSFSTRGSAGRLDVDNSSAGSTLGTVVRKVQVFDAAGSSLGYVPVYDAIT